MTPQREGSEVDATWIENAWARERAGASMGVCACSAVESFPLGCDCERPQAGTVSPQAGVGS